MQVTSINGSKIKYRYAKFAYSRAEGHSIIKSYGKTYTAKLTGNTRYYKSAPWTKLNSVQAYRYSYHSQSFKKLKILIKSNKWNMFGTYYQNGSFYIKVSKGKVKTVISPVIFSMWLLSYLVWKYKYLLCILYFITKRGCRLIPYFGILSSNWKDPCKDKIC